MSDIETDAGTTEPREGTAFCSTCNKYVTSLECGTDIKHVEDFAAITAAWPCLFPNGRPPKLPQKGS